MFPPKKADSTFGPSDLQMSFIPDKNFFSGPEVSWVVTRWVIRSGGVEV